MRRESWHTPITATALISTVLIALIGGSTPARAEVDEVLGDGGWAQAGNIPPGISTDDPNGQFSVASTPSDYPVHGVDVSKHSHAKHSISWRSVAASGERFAYIKATEGTTYINPYFASDFHNARRHGLFVGAYAFGRPDRGNPVGQANHLLKYAQWSSHRQVLIPMLDIEWPYRPIKLPACWGLTPSEMSAWIHAFVDQIERRIGRKPLIYTNSHWWNPCTGNDASFASYPLHISGYTPTSPPLPAGWTSFTFWQYAAGNPEVPGNFDKNVFNGDLQKLATLAGGRANPSVAGPAES